jgi:plastocyanin
LTEFFALLFSTLSPTVVGHPAWHFQPGYLDVRAGHSLRVTNNGGEGHTFTEVAVFGGGSIPLLNGVGGPVGTSPLIRAPECPLNPAALAVVAPRATVVLNLPPGAHNFQCCIHPWMRAVVDIEEEED